VLEAEALVVEIEAEDEEEDEIAGELSVCFKLTSSALLTRKRIKT
jgi:hypothetical protein